MRASSTLSALVAAVTIAATGTLVYAQTTTDPAAASPTPGTTTPSTALPYDATGRPAMPAEVTRPTPPAATMQANDAATTTAPGYSAGATSAYPGNSGAPADASTATPTTSVPAPTSRMRDSSAMPSSTMSTSTERTPRADRN